VGLGFWPEPSRLFKDRLSLMRFLGLGITIRMIRLARAQVKIGLANMA
jgi:hypothetical protein